MAPLKLAIIGGGPSSFYVASRLLSIFPQSDAQLRIHIYDRLWAPHGLVRYGVAPDHPEVKVRPRILPLRLAIASLKTSPELHTPVRPSRQRPPPTFLRERAGRPAGAPTHPARPSYIPILPPTTLHTPPLLHRLRHPHVATRLTALRPRYPRALSRPLVHATPVASRCATATRNRACLHNRSG